MKRNIGYTLMDIAGVPYLLPFGQMVADHQPGIRLNETGIYLWNLMEQDRPMEELVRLCAESYEVKDSTELRELTADIKEFVTTLQQRGILEDNTSPSAVSSCEKYLKIGGLITRLEGPEEMFSTNFDTYCIAPCAKIHQTVRVHIGTPTIKQNGKILLRNEELIVMERQKGYILLFPTAPRIVEAYLSSNGSNAEFYCLPSNADTLSEDLFHAIRLVWLYLAQQHNMMVIHSASLLYQGKAWLFSGPSGTGKSTHTNLWKRLFDTPILNGDLNLLAIENGQAVIHGLPWCGTSGISVTDTYPLGGIILLKQAKEDIVEELPNDRKQISVMNRFISPCWNEDMLRHNLIFSQTLAERIMICQLKCTMENSAAHTMRAYIDKFMHTYS